MRYVVSLAEPDTFDRWEAMTDEEREAVFARFAAFDARVQERGGTIVAGEALDRPETARTLRDGVVTEGPYAETVEQVGAVFVVEMSSIEEVLDAARLLPASYTIEVRATTAEG